MFMLMHMYIYIYVHMSCKILFSYANWSLQSCMLFASTARRHQNIKNPRCAARSGRLYQQQVACPAHLGFKKLVTEKTLKANPKHHQSHSLVLPVFFLQFFLFTIDTRPAFFCSIAEHVPLLFSALSREFGSK